MTAAVLIYDGDCAFCTTSVQWLADLLPKFPRALPYQRFDYERFGLTLDDVHNAAWLIDRREPQRMWRGAEAFAALLAGQDLPVVAFAGRLLSAPGYAQFAALGYCWLAANRHRLPGGTPACSLPPAERDAR